MSELDWDQKAREFLDSVGTILRPDLREKWLNLNTPALAALLREVATWAATEQSCPAIWCNAGPGHKRGTGICTCPGARDVKAARSIVLAEVRRVVEETRPKDLTDVRRHGWVSCCDAILKHLEDL